ncbi:MAG: Txe/YoeB family addiction module toxin [Pleurocapsa sp.]
MEAIARDKAGEFEEHDLLDGNLYWDRKAWEDYIYWQSQDKKTLKRINKLIQNTLVTPFTGIGKPEPLKENLSGYWSRRIDETNRLIYDFKLRRSLMGLITK